jgi:tetratricopeptide (TPR) repeat protein
MAHYCLANSLPPNKPDKQAAELQKSVAIYPDFFDAQVVLGKFLLVDGHFSEAIAPFEKAMQLEPQNGWAYHDLGITFSRLDRVVDAVPPLLKAVEIEPQNDHYKDDLSRILYSNNHGQGAINSFLATVRSDPAGFDSFFEAMKFDTNHAVFINDLAWSFATYPDPRLRNGKYAIRLATRTCEMTGFQSHSKVLALAAAYAEDSRFDDAISNAQLACSLASAAGQPELLKGDQALLELFRSHQPYHEPIKASSP